MSLSELTGSLDAFEMLPGSALCIHMPTGGLTLHQGMYFAPGGAPNENRDDTYVAQMQSYNSSNVISLKALVNEVGLDSNREMAGDISGGQVPNGLRYLKLREQFTTASTFDLGLYTNVEDGEGWNSINSSTYTISGGSFVGGSGVTNGFLYQSNRFPVELYRDEYFAMKFTTPSNLTNWDTSISLEGMTDGATSALRGLYVRCSNGNGVQIREAANLRASAVFAWVASTTYHIVAYRYQFNNGTALVDRVSAELYDSAGVLITFVDYDLTAPETALYNGTKPFGWYTAGNVGASIDWFQWYPFASPVSGPRLLIEYGVTGADVPDKLWFKQALVSYAALVPGLRSNAYASAALEAATVVEDNPPTTPDSEELRGTTTGYDAWSGTKTLDWAEAAGQALDQTRRFRFGMRGRRFTLILHQGHVFNKDTRIRQASVFARPRNQGVA